jgi:cytochrome c-type biogenesis protein CcmF
VVLLALGVIGSEMFQTETQGSIAVGESLSLGRYSMTYDSLVQSDEPDGRRVTRATVTVYRDGREVKKLFPQEHFYYASGQPMTIPGVRSTIKDDLYVILVGWEPIAEEGATFKIYHNPLVNFVWMSGAVFILGAIIAIWSRRDPVSTRHSTKEGEAYARA